MMLWLQIAGAFLLACNVAESRMTFLALGDWGAGSSRQKSVASSMANWASGNNAKFIVTLGDNFYPNGVKSSTDSQFKTKWRDIYSQSSLRNMSWYVSIGNHDYHHNNEFNQVKFSQRERRWKMPHLWHAFKRTDGGVRTHFIIIDTEAIRGKKNDYKTQLAWFESQLKNSNSDYIFVFGHRQMYSVGHYGPYSNTMRNVVKPLLEKYKADIYFSGHDHNQQHFRKKTNPDVDYVLHGGGGKGLYSLNTKHKPTLDKIGIATKYSRSRGGFLGVLVSSSQVIVQFRGSSGSLYYSFSRKKQRR